MSSDWKEAQRMFSVLEAAALAKLLPDVKTQEALALARDEYRSNLMNVAASPFSADQRKTLILSIQLDYLDALESLSDSEPDVG